MLPAEVEARAEPLGGRVQQTVLASGACSMIVGVVIAVWPHEPLPAAEVLVGAYLSANGILQLVVAFAARLATGLRALVMVSAVLSGMMAALCFGGGNSALLLAMWVGSAWVVRGVCHATMAAWAEGLPGSGRHEIVGLLTMATGALVCVLPFDSLDAVGWVVGLGQVALGAAEMSSVVSVRRRPGRPRRARADRVVGAAR